MENLRQLGDGNTGRPNAELDEKAIPPCLRDRIGVHLLMIQRADPVAHRIGAAWVRSYAAPHRANIVASYAML